MNTKNKQFNKILAGIVVAIAFVTIISTACAPKTEPIPEPEPQKDSFSYRLSTLIVTGDPSFDNIEALFNEYHGVCGIPDSAGDVLATTCGFVGSSHAVLFAWRDGTLIKADPVEVEI